MARESAYLDKAIGRYPPDVAAVGRAALRKLRSRFPGARILVFERRQALPIGFAPTERGSAVFSIVLYPRWVRFFFLEGTALSDPEGRLEGSGNQVRSLRLDAGATVLDEPYVRGLMAQALKVAGVNLRKGKGQVELRQVRGGDRSRSNTKRVKRAMIRR
jgi:hypothetical protein